MAAAAAVEARIYSGSIEFLRGGQVDTVRACACPRCSVFALPRVYGRVSAIVTMDGRRWPVEHARRESLGLEA